MAVFKEALALIIPYLASDACLRQVPVFNLHSSQQFLSQVRVISCLPGLIFQY